MIIKFNQYNPPQQKIRDFYKMDDNQQNEMILEETKIHAEKVDIAAKENSEKLEKLNEIDKNSIINCYEKEIFANLIKINFKEGRFGYIDPLSEWSIANIKNMLIADKRYLSFQNDIKSSFMNIHLFSCLKIL